MKTKVTNQVSKLKRQAEDNEKRVAALKNLQVDITQSSSQPISKDVIKTRQNSQAKLQEVCIFFQVLLSLQNIWIQNSDLD